MIHKLVYCQEPRKILAKIQGFDVLNSIDSSLAGWILPRSVGRASIHNELLYQIIEDFQFAADANALTRCRRLNLSSLFYFTEGLRTEGVGKGREEQG